jgi:hypothetical protein
MTIIQENGGMSDIEDHAPGHKTMLLSLSPKVQRLRKQVLDEKCCC